MKPGIKSFALAAALTLSAGALALAASGTVPSATSGFQIAVDATGAIRVPDIDYRKDWVMLGAWAVGKDDGEPGSQGMHIVYSQPEAVSAYRMDGRFPDGSVLIKELFSTATQEMTTGTVSRVNETAGWFVMVKDATGRFSDNKLWGDGWGWAYFDAKDPVKTTSSDYAADCKGCHVPAQKNDWVYVEGYPVLGGE